MKIITKIYALVYLFLQTTSIPAATGVGNGGDVVGTYLDEIRYKLIEALHTFAADNQENQASLCNKQDHLSSIQKKDCAIFVAKVAQDIIDLNIHENHTPFVLSLDPIFVTDEDGHPKRVAAKTLSGPEGEIDFDYEMISSRNPRLMLALIFHEFGHKARLSYQAGEESLEFVTDYGKVLSFAKGNELLDAAGLSLADWAIEKNIIGNGFSVLDIFQCQSIIHVGGQDISGGYFRSYDTRIFNGNAEPPQKFYKYSMGIGPGHQMQFGLPGDKNTELVYGLEITENANCDEDVNENRKSVVTLSRVVKDPQTGGIISSTLIDQKTFAVNPACAKDPLTIKPFSVASDNVTLSCQYIGSMVNTISAVLPSRYPLDPHLTDKFTKMNHKSFIP